MTTPVPTKYTAAKFWVAFAGAMLSTLSLLSLPGWWGKGVGIALMIVTSAGVFFKANTPIYGEETVHSGG